MVVSRWILIGIFVPSRLDPGGQSQVESWTDGPDNVNGRSEYC